MNNHIFLYFEFHSSQPNTKVMFTWRMKWNLYSGRGRLVEEFIIFLFLYSFPIWAKILTHIFWRECFILLHHFPYNFHHLKIYTLIFTYYTHTYFIFPYILFIIFISFLLHIILTKGTLPKCYFQNKIQLAKNI